MRKHNYPANRKSSTGWVRKSDRRNTTGVVGISEIGRIDRGKFRRLFRVVTRAGGKRAIRTFSISTLGREEAWRRAVRCRAAHELACKGGVR